MTLSRAIRASEVVQPGQEVRGAAPIISPRRVASLLLVITALFSLVDIGAKSKAQLLCAPLVVLLISRISLAGRQLPRWAVWSALCGVVVGALSQFSSVTLQKGAFLVATVAEHELKPETKIYRDRMRKVIGASGESLVGMYHGTIRSEAEARALLKRSPALGGAVWGAERWMTASFQAHKPLSLDSFPDDSGARVFLRSTQLADMLVVTSVPSVSLSHGHTPATTHFLGGIVTLWRDFREVVAPLAAAADFEGQAYALSGIQARWTSRAHLALPMWFIGTQHLVRAIEKSEVEPAELACAISMLRQALMQFRRSDNPALEAAVRNNYGLALMVQSEGITDGGKLWKRGVRQLSSVARLQLEEGVVRAVVRHNLLALKARKRGR